MRPIRAIAISTLVVAAGVAALATAASSRSPGGHIFFGAICRADHLTAKMTHIAGSSKPGHTAYALTLHNRAAGKCRINPWPRLTLLGADGKPLPTHLKTEGHGTPLLLAAGGSISAHLRFSPDIPGPGEPQHGPCEPAAHRLEVHIAFAGKSHGTVVGPIEPPTSVCEHGTIQQPPLR